MISKILSVLVVDDELPIREELKLFDWESRGTVLVGDVSNGVKALSFCEEYTPDIVITDITMPLMDGITLTRELKLRYPQVQIILLTCHSDFNYVREALHLGALDYLVKVTLEDNELDAALSKARMIIEKEKIYKDRFHDEQRWKQSQLIRQYLNNELLDEKALILELELLGLCLEFPIRIIRLQLSGDKNNRLFVNREIQGLLYKLQGSLKSPFTWIPIGVGEYLCFSPTNIIELETLIHQMKYLINFLNKEVEKSLSYLTNEVGIYVIISEPIDSVNSITSEILEMASWKKQKFYNNKEKVIVGKAPYISNIKDQNICEIETELRKVQREKDKLLIFFRKDFIEWFTKKMIEPLEVKEFILRWVIEWLSNDEFESIPGLTQRILDSSTLSEMVLVIIHAIETKSGVKKPYRTEIQQATKLIHERISEPITLAVIADEVSMSPNYISRLFREEVGTTFNDYLTQVRMEQAIFLLKNTNMKVYEVAENVGIPSYRYFSTLFRKWTGKTPTEYKKG